MWPVPLKRLGSPAVYEVRFYEILLRISGQFNQCTKYITFELCMLSPICKVGRSPPHFGLLKILFVEHHVTTRQQAMMEKGIITFKYKFPLAFSRFFAKLLATKCCT